MNFSGGLLSLHHLQGSLPKRPLAAQYTAMTGIFSAV
jgi:hypothetical protein